MPMDTISMDSDNEADFTTRTIEAAGVAVEISEAGAGAALLYVSTSEISGDALAQLLAREFRLTALSDGGDFATLSQAMKARRLASVIDALGLDACNVCASGPDAAAALHLVADAPERVQRAVLVAPKVYDANGVLHEPALAEKIEKITSQTLVLFGTDAGGACDAPASFYRQNIPNCHLMYVYDAAIPGRDRPGAAASVIADFLHRGDGFLVSARDGRVHP